jgi:hypothetical protein
MADADAKVVEVPVAVVSAETVTGKLAAAMLGLTVSALNGRRASGVWAEGKHWFRREDGTIWYDIPAIERWVRTGT